MGQVVNLKLLFFLASMVKTLDFPDWTQYGLDNILKWGWWNEKGKPDSTTHLLVTLALAFSFCHFWVQCFVKLLWRWHTVKFSSPRAPWSCGGDLISDQSWSLSRSLAFVVSCQAYELLSCASAWKEKVLFWNLMIRCVLKWKRECRCVCDPKIVQESVAVFLHTLRDNERGN